MGTDDISENTTSLRLPFAADDSKRQELLDNLSDSQEPHPKPDNAMPVETSSTVIASVLQREVEIFCETSASGTRCRVPGCISFSTSLSRWRKHFDIGHKNIYNGIVNDVGVRETDASCSLLTGKQTAYSVCLRDEVTRARYLGSHANSLTSLSWDDIQIGNILSLSEHADSRLCGKYGVDTELRKHPALVVYKPSSNKSVVGICIVSHKRL